MNTEPGKCYLCGLRCKTHKHHIFDGPNRRLSEKDNFIVYLCPNCHNMGRVNVHNNIALRRQLQREAQKEYEQTHTRDEFIKRYGRSFL